MWPFRRKKREIGPPPVPEPWDWESALGVRMNYIMTEHQDVFRQAAISGASDFCVSFEKIGSVTAKLRPLSDGRIHFDWGLWMPYDPDESERSDDDAPHQDPGSELRLVISTSPLEQTRRGFIFTLDDFGNSILIPPMRVVPREDEVERIKSDPSVQKIPVGIGTRPEKYVYFLY